MNMFKRANRVYVRYTSTGETHTVTLDRQGDGIPSHHMELVGRKNGDVLVDGEIAELIRKLDAEGYNVIRQRRTI